MTDTEKLMDGLIRTALRPDVKCKECTYPAACKRQGVCSAEARKQKAIDHDDDMFGEG